MWENAYLSIKNPKASRALKQALDPGCKLLTSLHQQLSASELGPLLDQILDPHLCNIDDKSIILSSTSKFDITGQLI